MSLYEFIIVKPGLAMLFIIVPMIVLCAGVGYIVKTYNVTRWGKKE